LLPITWAVKATERALVVGQSCLTVGSAVGVLLLSRTADWQPVELFFLLLGVADVSEAFRLEGRNLNISATFLSVVLAMTLLGPAPAAVLGVTTILINALKLRAPLRATLANVSTFAFFPLLGGLMFRAMGGNALLDGEVAAIMLIVLAVFLSMNVLNFLLIAVDIAVVDGQSIPDSFRLIYLPIAPVELAVGLLTAGVAFAYQQEDLAVIGLLAVVGLIFQYLLRTALNSLDRKEKLEGRTRQLASLQVGLLSTVLQTLSLRDKMTARHSAAVARYSREIAKAMGLGEDEQDLVHTAALLHDIGKFIFPDSILFADSKLTAADMDIVRRHPEQGARLVAQIEGYGPVAEIILAHHERVDGHGYPNGLVAAQIPVAARIISVADTYDVMTSRDSYRRPVSSREAIEELRRVSGAQLDGEVVETFVSLLEERTITFRHADDADFERELNLEARVRLHAEPRVMAA
jgi:putative nucleotidyltransferase with HDIG domain